MTDLRSKIENWILALTSEWNSRLYDQDRYVPDDQCYDLEGTGLEALNLTDDEHLWEYEEMMEGKENVESLTDEEIEETVDSLHSMLCLSPTD